MRGTGAEVGSHERLAGVIFATLRILYRVKAGLSGFDVDDSDLRVDAVPIWGDRVEDEAEVVGVAGLERRGRDRFQIDIRLANADEPERLGLILGHLMS